jgi:hypothetical protein
VYEDAEFVAERTIVAKILSRGSHHKVPRGMSGEPLLCRPLERVRLVR